jgi:hypothetical protein
MAREIDHFNTIGLSMKNLLNSSGGILALSLLALAPLAHAADNADVNLTVKTSIPSYFAAFGKNGDITEAMTMNYSADADSGKGAYTNAEKIIYFISSNPNRGLKMTFNSGDIMTNQQFLGDPIPLHLRLSKGATNYPWMTATSGNTLSIDSTDMGWTAKDGRSSDFTLVVAPVDEKQHPSEGAYSANLNITFEQGA